VNNITIVQAKPENFEAISKLIADQNKDPASHCIQSDTADNYQIIQNEIVRLAAQGELCFMAAIENGALIGTMGGEFDPEIGRGWTRGPFVISKTIEWAQVASRLLQGLLNSIPSTIHLLDSFLNIANERGNNFYLANGFQQIRLFHVYVAKALEKPVGHFTACESIHPHQE
jgi:hypothetical protein